MSSSRSPQVVFTGPEPMAQMVKGRLESAGIEAYLWGENIAGELPLGESGILGFGAVKVVVPEEELEKAKAVLAP